MLAAVTTLCGAMAEGGRGGPRGSPIVAVDGTPVIRRSGHPSAKAERVSGMAHVLSQLRHVLHYHQRDENEQRNDGNQLCNRGQHQP